MQQQIELIIKGVIQNTVSVQFSHAVVSNSLWPRGLQHTRLPCPSPTPGACSNSRPFSWWYHPTISSSAVPISSCLQSCPTSGSFVMSQFFVSGGQSIGWSFSFSISPSNEYSGLTSFRMDWLDLLAVQETLKSCLQHHSSKASVLWHSAFFMVQLSHPYMTTGKTIALTRQTFFGKVTSLLFNMLSRFVMERAMAPHSSTLAWKIPCMEDPGGLQSMGSLRVRRDWATSLSLFTFMHWRRKWQPTPVFLPGADRGSLVSCRLWGRTESDTTEMT